MSWSSACGSTVIVDGKTGIVTAPPAGSVKPMRAADVVQRRRRWRAAESSGMNVNEIVPVLSSGSVAMPLTTLKAPL